MKTKSNINLIITGLILFIFTINLSGQINFNEPTNQPVISYGNPDDWDDGTVWFPAVIKDSDTLRLWYTGLDDIVWQATTNGVGYAWSLDGINWIKDTINNPLMVDHGSGSIIKDGDTIKMWYGLNDGMIHYATSVDGITWEIYPGPVLSYGPVGDWDDWVVGSGTVIKEANEYKMWFGGQRPGFPQIEALPQIGFATSPDGINWTKYDDPATGDAPYASSDPVLKVGEEDEWDAHRAFIPNVIKNDCGYEMFYTGLKGPINTSVEEHIGYAISEDGIVWEKYPDNPVLTDPREWGSGIYGGTVLKYDGYYHLWFACFHSLTTMASPQIGYAKSLAENITCLSGGFSFTNQAQIDNFRTDHPFCNKIGGDVKISGNDITNLDGFCILNEIDGDLEIHDNTTLINLNGLNNLESISGDFAVYGNNILEDFTGLDNLKSIDGNLEIFDNNSLSSLSGLDSIAPGTIIDLTIAVNNNLSYCAIINICEYLADPNGTTEIHDNATGCNNPEEVEEACITNVYELSNENTFTILPNPISSTSVIEYALHQSSQVTMQIIDVNGQVIETFIYKNKQKGEQQIPFDGLGLKPGIYFCVLKTPQYTETKKIIKLN